jgi:exodeoxyribonuclease-3
VRITTLNVNGIRAAENKGLSEWLAGHGADVVCLQEVRAREDQVPARLLELPGYQPFWHCAERGGYSGVGILARQAPEAVTCGMGHAGHDAEGRVIRADFPGLSVISVYVPSGTSGEDRLKYKMGFLDDFLAHLVALKESGREIVVTGDFNIAHKPVDLKNWRANQNYSGFLPEERAWLDRLVEAGFVDVHRYLIGPEVPVYSWWSNRGKAREKDVGWRLDYHFATPATAGRAREAAVYRDGFFSDHAPVTIDYDGLG